MFVKSEPRQTRHINDKENVMYKSQTSVQDIFVGGLSFFQCVFDKSDRSSREFMSKSMNHKQQVCH